MKASAVKSALKMHASTAKAKSSARFFKTGPGEYGEGDKFIGVTVPEQRRVAREFKDLGLSEVEKLLQSSIHEHRLTALFILVGQFQRAKKDPKLEEKIFKLYLKNKKYVNNWDLVDSSAHKIIGPWLWFEISGRIPARGLVLLSKLARSRSLWDRRIAIISTFAFIDQGELGESIRLAKILLHDKEDLMHKAVGWVLREVGKKDMKVLRKFLDQHAHEMPRTMLRYAIEKMGKNEREKYLKLRAKS